MSDAETAAVEDLLALEPGIEGLSRTQRLGYTNQASSEEPRDAIANEYQTVAPNNVLVFAAT